MEGVKVYTVPLHGEGQGSCTLSSADCWIDDEKTLLQKEGNFGTNNSLISH